MSMGTLMSLLRLRRKPAPPAEEPPPPAQLIRLGGQLIDAAGWPDEVIERIRKEYLLPSRGDDFLYRLDMTGTCPSRHITTYRVGIFAENGEMAKEVADAMPKARLQFTCGEDGCQRRSLVSGRTIVFSGPFNTWDGAT